MGRAKSQASYLEQALRADGVRITRQRTALLKVLAEAKDHPDANELHSRAREIDPTMSLATVYRTLTALEQQGLVHRHVFEGASARFEIADARHHDHIIDIDKGEIIEFRSPEIERLQEQIAERHGYEIVSHKLELYCRKKAT
ncbi:Fur family transcriptional regulator [Propylenella binzhouense]|uniref:Ferric uptake regulation protein n=1 Tax=Propylenella binzhouense TaxID=2555902 RepID=A0A964WVX6_9HYPH|nr:Fur family transcriptional regulator [Propylenella binzhouense]MYZ50285.1 transcriptional repressor [Propylenella binzhouense]